MLKLFVCTSLALVVSCAEIGDGGDDETTGQFVIGGYETSGFPAVGKLITFRRLCTGTLIGQTSFLTAAHCVDGIASIRNTWVRFDNGDLHKPRSIELHPKYKEGSLDWDVAIVRLEDWVDESVIEPVPIRSEPLVRGRYFWGVGYGNTSYDDDDFGTKKYFYNYVDNVKPWSFSYDNNGGNGHGCFGDSGSPALRAEDGQSKHAVWGVYSKISGADEGCQGGTYHYMRVDKETAPDIYDWIEDSVGSDWCHKGDNMGLSYCSSSCPCDIGQGDCDSDSQCQPGLKCVHNVGEGYGAPSYIDVCEPVE